MTLYLDKILIICLVLCQTFAITQNRVSKVKSHFLEKRNQGFVSTDFDQSHYESNPDLQLDCKVDCPSCPNGAFCVPPVQCPAHVRSHSAECHLQSGRIGICCTTGQSHSNETELLSRTSIKIDPKFLDDAHLQSKLKMAKLVKKETEILNNRKHKSILPRGSPAFGHYQSQRSTNFKDSHAVGLVGLLNIFATHALKERQSISNHHISLGLEHVVLHDSPCHLPPLCLHPFTHHRSLDGTCNNIFHTSWGASHTANERLLPPNYHNGIWSPRVSVTGKSLPSARTVSANLVPDKNRPHSYNTVLTMQFGQFLAHDMSSSVTQTFGNGNPISCCSEDGSSTIPQKHRHHACYPIEIDPQDNFFATYKQNCMNFVRTQLAPNHDCSLGYAKQMNGVTHYLDLSQVYGSNAETISPLREWSGGRMKMFNDFGRDLLPLSDDKNDCITMEHGSACFKSGDGHVNQMISLVAVHTIFNREHNRVAGILASLNPHWSEQTLFLEARRIVIAEYQHIIYSEWLPLVIGYSAMSEFSLWPYQQSDYSSDYDKSVNPSLTNEFSVAAFRFGHSNVDGKLRLEKNEEPDEVIAAAEVMLQPTRMRIREYYDRILNSLTKQPMQETDPSLSDQLTRYMFHTGHPFGIDLASLNIQRGRDHGLRSYNDYRELTGQPKLRDFNDFEPEVAEKLSKTYASVDDIDLWLGGLLEKLVKDALVGLSFREIISDQFSRLRRGDRYFYEHNPDINPGYFTPSQLAEIKKASMARLICDNSDNIEVLSQSPNAFLKRDLPGNEPHDCRDPFLHMLDFSSWRES